ncbi:alpha/beta hydrolase [Cryobacterium sp. PH31-O1]|uniref:alpha/beta hydrolase n=1 Tax=Cryobacterium sp. PH31-O1 TaxID=3046306 RepID=UPI0024BAC52A|nr:alpha/beta hydrolase [Cryobacterium sp. PH31-O1]MDJ0336650.1 alpha/beta hydrolase [Cryobacterium sp. PH31-O1]
MGGLYSPESWSRIIAGLQDDSTLLTVEGDGHAVVSSGASPCVDEIATAYLIDLALPESELSCTL